MKIDRRNLLRLIGFAGASYALMSVGRNVARAGGSGIPRRVVFFYTEQGTHKQFVDGGSGKPAGIVSSWTPTVNGGPDAYAITAPWSTSSFTLRDIHAPLAPFQKKLTFLDGLDMVSSTVDPTPAGNAHINGETHALVAANRQTDSLAGGISIDQFIAKSINSPSPLTVVPSLEIALTEDAYPYENDSIGAEAAPVYAAAGQPMTIENNPLKVYNRILPNGPVDNDPNAAAKLAAQLALQKSVLDYTQADFARASARMSSLDRARLDAHGSAIRDLEKRLTLNANVACTEPSQDNVVKLVNGVDRGTASFKAHLGAMMQLAQVTLACDLARVVTFCVPQAPDDLFGYVAGTSGTTDFHDLCHQTNGVKPPLADDAAALGMLTAYHTYNASLFAQLLGLLDAIPEADGTTLLDNTLVVWCGQIAAGDHSLDHLPYILAGGMGGAVTPGRYVRYPRTYSDQAWPVYSQGPAHNDLFVAIANMMGVATSTFGNPAVCKGSLPGLV